MQIKQLLFKPEVWSSYPQHPSQCYPTWLMLYPSIPANATPRGLCSLPEVPALGAEMGWVGGILEASCPDGLATSMGSRVTLKILTMGISRRVCQSFMSWEVSSLS